ncbi:MAG: dihydrolipoyl dehydrogenase [Myxococcales bacterium]|nr:dihydrolipoyl dehydrogenase [Myxococcales bacterium]
MSPIVEILTPDIGDFDSVEVIEVLVSAGDRVDRDDSLITIESDKASMEIPSPQAGVIRELCVELGSHVSEGSLILRLEAADSPQPVPAESISTADASPTESTDHEPLEQAPPLETPTEEAPAIEPPRSFTPSDRHAEIVVIGGGPGGYTAAFRAADLGKQVVLIERYEKLGGVCLNVGCIPSKALLHIAEVVSEVRELHDRGVDFGEPSFDLDRMRAFKDRVVGDLTQGLSGLAKRRKISVLRGHGRFSAADQVSVETGEGTTTVSFDDCIIAAGSQAVELSGIPNDDPRVMDSTAALLLEEIPDRLLVIGGGIIGLEMAAVYDALGSKITLVELTDELIPGCDRDLVKPLQSRIAKRYERILLGTKVTRIKAQQDGLEVSFEGGDAPESDRFDRVLVAVGRRPNGHAIDARKAGVAVDDRGFIAVDSQMRTNAPHIYAIGDIVGEPMLAHKATHEGKTAAEVIAGLPAAFDPKAIPSVAYTDPEVAWMGLSEAEAQAKGIRFEKVSFPWLASGRAQGIGRSEGVTKLIFDAEDRRLLGAGIVGRNAGELIAEAVLALELGADAEDLALTIHAHPTLSETLNFGAEMFEGTITDLYIPRRKTRSGG